VAAAADVRARDQPTGPRGVQPKKRLTPGVSETESAVAGQPRDGALDHTTPTAEAVMGVGGGEADDQGQAVRVRQAVKSWNPTCPGSQGSDLRVRPLFLRLGASGDEDHAGDVDQSMVVELVQDCLV
jgi:hypothetical protein